MRLRVFQPFSQSLFRTVLATAAASLVLALPQAGHAVAFHERHASPSLLITVKGGLSGSFNGAAGKPGSAKPSWTTKPVYPLWKGKPTPRAPFPAPKPKGAFQVPPAKPYSRLPQHFNYKAQRPLRFDFNRSAR